jgi:hypothetical protein
MTSEAKPSKATLKFPCPLAEAWDGLTYERAHTTPNEEIRGSQPRMIPRPGPTRSASGFWCIFRIPELVVPASYKRKVTVITH